MVEAFVITPWQLGMPLRVCQGNVGHRRYSRIIYERNYITPPQNPGYTGICGFLTIG